jgi:vacuolar-type H+-ATPase subunit E/Vma4
MSETSKFTEDILTVAKMKAQTIIDEAKLETERTLEEAKVRSSREADDLLSNARAEAEGVKRRRISEARHKMNLQEQLEKSKILSDVLEQTRTCVKEIVMDDENYFPYLSSLVSSGIDEIGLDAVVIHLNAADQRRINQGDLEREIGKNLGRAIKVEFSKEPIEAFGGAVVSSKDGRTRIVNTLDQRFEALEPRLLIEAGKMLFSQ